MPSVNSVTIPIQVTSNTRDRNQANRITSGDTGAYIIEITYSDITSITGTVNLHFVLGDGTYADRDASDGVVLAGNKVTYTLEAALYSVAGNLTCYVQFLNSNLFTPLKITFSGVQLLPGTTPVAAAEPYPAWITAVASAEALRVIAESNRVIAEAARVTAEGTVSTGRVKAEADRVTAEGSRVTVEGNRVTAEQGRVSAEGSRVSAEAARAVWEAFNALDIYAVGNKVAHLGSSYIMHTISGIAGTLPTDTNYWALIAQAGAAGTINTSTLTNMTGLIAGGGTNIQAPTAAQVGALPMPDAGNYFTGDDQLATQMQSVGSQLAQIAKPLISEFVPLNVLVTGDSITDPVGTASTKWPALLASWYGMTVQNDGKSATGLIRANGGTPGIYTRIDTWDATYNDFDVVLVMGNMNDGGIGPATFPVGVFANNVATDSQYGAMHKTIQKLLTKYPSKRIGWIVSTPRLASTTYPVPHNGPAWGVDGWFEPYCQAILEVCRHYSIPCLDLYHESGMHPWNTQNNLAYFDRADGVHPNNKGQVVMAYKIYNFIKSMMAGNRLVLCGNTFEANGIVTRVGYVIYTNVTARARMRISLGAYQPGIFVVHDPTKINIGLALFQNPVYDAGFSDEFSSGRTSGFLNNTYTWATSQRMSHATATHYQLGIKNMSGADFTAGELANMNKYISFIPD